ncbi:hypothetical protein BX616_009068 [Lobosporangium transversale]|nr:hypothetical protein BX616_009068 [Lobosporangium transversale]
MGNVLTKCCCIKGDHRKKKSNSTTTSSSFPSPSDIQTLPSSQERDIQLNTIVPLNQHQAAPTAAADIHQRSSSVDSIDNPKTTSSTEGQPVNRSNVNSSSLKSVSQLNKTNKNQNISNSKSSATSFIKRLSTSLQNLSNSEINKARLPGEDISASETEQLQSSSLEQGLDRLPFALTAEERKVLLANEIPASEIENLSIGVDAGGMGIIHVAEWKGIKVAIKEASDHVISKEVEIYNRMKGFEGVVQFYGVTYPPGLDKLCIVTKYAEQGSLSWHLRVGFHKLTWADKLTLATQISASIARLHKEGVFHRDLHGGNILIDEAGNAMLTDFGASTMEERVVRSVDEYAISTTTNSEGQYKFVSQKMPALDSPDKDEATTTGVPDGHGPAEDKSDPLIGVMAYIAPERFRNPRYFDARCDIYSLGVLLWELTSGHSAFSKTPQDVQFALSILNGKREQAIPGTPESYRALYECCWDTNPEMRPSLDEILSTLEEVRQELSPEELAATSERSTVPNGDGESDFEESLSVPRPTSDYQEYLIPESEEQS